MSATLGASVFFTYVNYKNIDTIYMGVQTLYTDLAQLQARVANLESPAKTPEEPLAELVRTRQVAKTPMPGGPSW